MEYETASLNISPEEIFNTKPYIDQTCQVDECMFMMQSAFKSGDPGKTLICNRLVSVTIDNETKKSILVNDAETQTDILLAKVITVPSQKTTQDKGCNTATKVYVDSSVTVEPQDLGVKLGSFHGYESLPNEKQLLDLAGVTFETLEFLLERTPVPSDNCKLSRQNRLFILLMKLKSGLSFSALAALFSVHRTTVSKIFVSTLQYLASSTANLVFWPSKAQVQGSMPKCFYPDYTNTRVIIDCTECRIKNSAGTDNRIFTFFRYKHGFTAKFLLGITPSEFICLKSKVAGGRESDSQITIESGLIDLLEEGDVVLADKSFPEIRKVIDDSGKSALIVLPPYLEKKTQFTKEETEQTYKIASVRIHVERVIQRLRTYNILHKIPASLFHHMNDLVHVICVLVNLQPPIHAEEKSNGND